MPAKAPQYSTGSALSKLADDHRELRLTLERVEEAKDLTTLIPLLKDLLEQLKQHFATEEAADGLPLTIGPSNPQHLRRMEQLFEEHRVFLATTAAVIERAQALLDGPKTDILKEVQHLSHDLRIHEETETEIVMDSVYSDIGSGD